MSRPLNEKPGGRKANGKPSLAGERTPTRHSRDVTDTLDARTPSRTTN